MKISEIISKARELGLANLNGNSSVDLDRIISDINIPVIHGFINSTIPGSLFCNGGNFYIILNDNPKASSDPKRLRFTLAHELGHYFIEHHRSELLQGNSLFVGNKFDDNTIKKWENEANEFAVNLLMPTDSLTEYIQDSELTMNLIEKVSDRFQVSTECAAINLIKLSPKEIALIKWRYESKNYCSLSSKLYSQLKKTKIKLKLVPSDDMLAETDTTLKNNASHIFEDAVLSNWISSMTKADYPYTFSVEARLNEGFGGMALLTRK